MTLLSKANAIKMYMYKIFFVQLNLIIKLSLGSIEKDCVICETVIMRLSEQLEK